MRFRFGGLALLLASFSTPVCHPQFVSPNQPQTGERETYSIAGTVTNAATGEPIRRALVQVNGPVQLSSFTGPDGRFQITGVPEGQAYVTAEKPGFWDERTLSQRQYASLDAMVNVGASTVDIHIHLVPEAGIRGRVVVPDGEPVDGLGVQLLAEDIVQGRKQLQVRTGGSTDENGNYALNGLTPGRYFLRTVLHPVFSLPSSREAYSPQYYPNVPDLSSAQAVELQAGQAARADFTVHPAPAFLVRGVCAGGQNGLSVSYTGLDGQTTMIESLRSNPATGQFAFRMPSGSWSLSFSSNDQQGNMFFAQRDLDIKGSDVTGLQVVLQPAATIPVVVNHAKALASTQNAPPASQGPGVQISLVSANNSDHQQFSAGQQEGEAPGSLSFRVPPGRYKVLVDAFGPECVESLSSGSSNLFRDDLLVAEGSQPTPIVVGLGNDCATLTASVRSDTQNGPAFVLLISDSARMQPKLFPTQRQASLSLANLTPDTYHLYAFSNIAGLEYANPEALRGYASHEITLEPNQKVSVTVDLIAREAE